MQRLTVQLNMMMPMIRHVENCRRHATAVFN